MDLERQKWQQDQLKNRKQKEEQKHAVKEIVKQKQLNTIQRITQDVQRNIDKIVEKAHEQDVAPIENVCADVVMLTDA